MTIEKLTTKIVVEKRMVSASESASASDIGGIEMQLHSERRSWYVR